jgi:hypothetical protein
MRRHAGGVGCGAAPAGGDGRTPAPGRPREPIGGYNGPSARSSLDWDCANDCRSAETPPARKGATPRPAGSEQKPGNADPGPVSLAKAGGAKPPWSAERRPHPSKEDAARRKTGAPLGAPPPRFFGGKKKGPAPAGWNTAYPGPERIRAMMLGCLKIKSEAARATGDDAGAQNRRWGGRPRDSDRHSRTRHRDSNDLPKRSGRASSNLATLS